MATKNGAATICYIENSYGRCEGTRACGPSGLSDCLAKAPNRDVCNGQDDDCDGATDEGHEPVETACGVGACASTGVLECVDGTKRDTCEAGVPAATDAACDGVDDDCDGATDEGYAPTPTTCGEGACASTGEIVCADGAEVDTCEPAAPAPDDATCDGVDGDCDGTTDEDYVATPTSCGEGACAATGLLKCADGTEMDTCEAGPPVASDDATCDGVDDDCDGATDEDYEPTPTNCGVGACASAGEVVCVDGAKVDTCEPGTPASDDTTCDGVDGDCDGATDEDYAPTATTCGVGACGSTGDLLCVDGTQSNTCEPGAPVASDDATCDGVDDDCDGMTDEDFAPTATTCGVGACASAGEIVCVDGAKVDTCEPGGPESDDATCDGVDDDCDGATDEDYAPTATTCGEGGCSSTGELVCVDGAKVDTCEPGAPASDDATCDGVDDDCDGATDEDYVPAATSCGDGACAATGELVCADGAEVDTCEPGTPASDDATCDGVDDDCDGATDEDYVSTPTSCGEGACASTGEAQCSNGVEVDTCEPGAPASDDATCDGVDDDCDGVTDEDYAPTATACGVGACASAGEVVCVDGAEVDTCEPGGPASDDATCDGVDDDCDGATDEDYAPTATTCGEGGCSSMGELVCVDGAKVDTCEPGAPAADDATCDGVDDDCDGATDEDVGWTEIAPMQVPRGYACGVEYDGRVYVFGGVSQSQSQQFASPTGSSEVYDPATGAWSSIAPMKYARSAAACGVLGDAIYVAGGRSTDNTRTVQIYHPDTDTWTSGPSLGTLRSWAGHAVLDQRLHVVGGVGYGYLDSATRFDPSSNSWTSAGSLSAGRYFVGVARHGDSLVAFGGNSWSGSTNTKYDTIERYDPAVNDWSVVGHLPEPMAGLHAVAFDDSLYLLHGATGLFTVDAADWTLEPLAPPPDTHDSSSVVVPTSLGVFVAGGGGWGPNTAAVHVSCGHPPRCLASELEFPDGTCADPGLCDGLADELYTPTPTECGTGPCTSTGDLLCVDGVEVDTCLPGAGASDDATCNGTDDDCDGSTDEDYTSLATTCGEGACASIGELQCADGVEVDTCLPGAGASGDATCDGVDDDCDGATDEDYTSPATTCGEGACASTGELHCIDGSGVDTC
ncbi:MAG: MopE-related protein, partial [Myxococcota bacterium]